MDPITARKYTTHVHYSANSAPGRFSRCHGPDGDSGYPPESPHPVQSKVQN